MIALLHAQLSGMRPMMLVFVIVFLTLAAIPFALLFALTWLGWAAGELMSDISYRLARMARSIGCDK